MSDKIDFTTLYVYDPDDPNHGIQGDFTISEPVTNFKFIEIYFGDSSLQYTKFIPNPTGSSVVKLSAIHRLTDLSTSNYFLQVATLTFNGTNVSYTRYGQMTLRNTGNTNDNGTPVQVYRVIGYK